MIAQFPMTSFGVKAAIRGSEIERQLLPITVLRAFTFSAFETSEGSPG